METKAGCKVCVTGGGGYIGSALVHLLLQNSYTVHATLRNLDDESKVGLLKSFPYAKERLHLFEADIYKPEEFEAAIKGCVFVFHVATPLQHTAGSKYNDITEATTNAVKTIAAICHHSGTVKRLIYTASLLAAAPWKDDGSGYKDAIDETCWTPLHLNIPYPNGFFKEYIDAKKLSEQEILKIGENKDYPLEIATVCCGLVGGGARLGYAKPSGSVLCFLSQILDNKALYESLRFTEEFLGKIPIVHIEDVCRAHILCAESPSANGRFFCASANVSSSEIAKYYQETYSQYNHLNKKYLEHLGREIKWGSTKLEEKGFVYKYDTKMILDDCLEIAKESGHI